MNPEDLFDTNQSTIGTGQPLQYDESQPDATVDLIEADPTNPAWSEVTFSDGRKATLPTSHAEELPKTQGQVPPTGGAYSAAAPFGPPTEANAPPLTSEQLAAPEEAPPLTPEQLAQRGVGGGTGGGFSGMGALGAGPLGGFAGGVNAAEAAGLQNAGGDTGTATPQSFVDPNTAIVSPGGPGGLALDKTTQTSGVSTNEYADSAETSQSRLADAANRAALGGRETDVQAREARLAGLDTADVGLERQQWELQRQQRQNQLEVSEHQRVIKAMEAHPLDEDAFWTSSPGREAGAWIALALSGFLQGATRGQNPALNQMVQAMNHAQDRFVQTQQAERDSVLKRREAAMGHAQNALDSVRMQLSGVMSKRIDLDAQRAGVPPVPGLETYKAKMAMDVAERQNAIGQRIVGQATAQSTQEAKAQPATGPTRQADVVLRNLLGPDYQKRHAEAMNPKKLNLGGQVQGASELQDVSKALRAIAARNGGSIPSQETVSLSSLGLQGLGARMGLQRGKDEVSAKQLIEQAKLAFKQTINIKSVDSENEGKNFNAIMDTGDATSTLSALTQKAQSASQDALSTADGVAPGAAQQYLEYIRSTQENNRGTQPKPTTEGLQEEVLKPGSGAGAAPQEAGAVDATTVGAGGGPAPSSPLAPAQPTPPTRGPTEPGSTPGGTYQRGRYRKQSL